MRSFPFMRIAREHAVSYADVLLVADRVRYIYRSQLVPEDRQNNPHFIDAALRMQKLPRWKHILVATAIRDAIDDMV